MHKKETINYSDERIIINYKQMKIAKILEYFGISIAVAFICMGIYLIATDAFNNLPSNYKMIFSSLLIAYGGFRLVSILLNIKHKKSYENDEE